MNKLLLAVSAAACLCTINVASAQIGNAGNANKDGMISKEEFMAFHGAKYDAMKKNKDGMVDVKDMPMMHHHHHHTTQ